MTGYYPGGEEGALLDGAVATFRCENEECESCGIEWEVDGTSHLGAWDPYDEDEMRCHDCGVEGVAA